MKLLVSALLAVCALGASANEFRIRQEAVHPRAIKWKKADDPNGTSDVCRATLKVPAEWKGKRVAFTVPYGLLKCDLVLDVNGRRAGDVYRPAGEVVISHLLKYGEDNEISVFLSASGKETARGASKIDVGSRNRRGLTARTFVTVTPETWISDVFANTSWRKKQVAFECEVIAPKAEKRTLAVEVLDAEGKRVFEVAREVELKAGENRVEIVKPWADATCWELGRPYLYTCRATIKDGAGKVADAIDPFRFGFRELWRDGREIMMNGHKVRFRTVYSFAARKWGAQFLRNVGYNVITVNHKSDACTVTDFQNEQLDAFDELGMGCFIPCGNAGHTVGYDTHVNPEMQEAYRKYQKTVQRWTRNHPSVMAMYVTQMILSDTKSHNPVMLGQYDADGPRFKAIETWRNINREYNPNVLYYSHADGPNGDLASGNLYLNFTPLQEREEWLSQWAVKGYWPWHSAEFGQPYDGNWYFQKLFLGTEHLAQFYGDAAYETEHPSAMTNAIEVAHKNHPWGHGCKTGAETMLLQPKFWEMKREWTWRTNSRWRAFGFNGGNDYFNLGEAYGTPPGGVGYGRYGINGREEDLLGKPDWANEGYDIHQLGNKDFCGFIGGTPEFTDRTHAYFSQEKIRKQVVMVWDGAVRKVTDVEWTVENLSRPRDPAIAGGKFTVAANPGDILKIPFEFDAPKVHGRTRYRIKCSFYASGHIEAFDSFPFEVYPAMGHAMYAANAPKQGVALFDPSGEGAKVLAALNVPFTKVETTKGVAKTHRWLVIGKNALDDTSALEVTADEIKSGLKMLILPQMPATWQAMGFKVQDTMSREMYLRDKENLGLKGVTDDMLAHWRGAPVYGDKPYGSIMLHSTQRGPRWTRNHTVAGLVLEIPPRVGFSPLIDGEFDMNYAALLRFTAGKGSITYCTLDFENRMAVDPAATAVAAGMFKDFFHGALTPANAAAKAEGPVRLKATLMADGMVYRAEPAGDAKDFRAIGPSLLRWTAPLKAEVAADGTFELPSTWFADQIPSFKTEDELKRTQLYQLNQERLNRLRARVATNRGAQPDDKVLERLLYQSCAVEFKPLPTAHILGPFEWKNDSKAVIEHEFPGEKMAIEGDYNPNIQFDMPQGGRTEWRLMLSPDESGLFDFRKYFPQQKSPVYLAICFVERQRAGDAMLKFGVDWRAKIWCNGELVKEVWNGMNYPGIEVPLKLKAGRNVIAFKIGGGTKAQEFHGLLENERLRAAGDRVANPELEKVPMYDNLVFGFDPYVFHYW